MNVNEIKYIEISDSSVRTFLEGMFSLDVKRGRYLARLIKRDDNTWLAEWDIDHSRKYT